MTMNNQQRTLLKTKPNKANLPAFGRKPEARNPIRLRQDSGGQEF